MLRDEAPEPKAKAKRLRLLSTAAAPEAPQR